MTIDYEQIYKQTHPKACPLSPWERQRQLSDLWPCDQQKFKDVVDVILKGN